MKVTSACPKCGMLAEVDVGDDASVVLLLCTRPSEADAAVKWDELHPKPAGPPVVWAATSDQDALVEVTDADSCMVLA